MPFEAEGKGKGEQLRNSNAFLHPASLKQYLAVLDQRDLCILHFLTICCFFVAPLASPSTLPGLLRAVSKRSALVGSYLFAEHLNCTGSPLAVCAGVTMPRFPDSCKTRPLISMFSLTAVMSVVPWYLPSPAGKPRCFSFCSSAGVLSGTQTSQCTSQFPKHLTTDNYFSKHLTAAVDL